MPLSTTILRAAGTLLSPAGRTAPLTVLMYHRVLSAPDPLTGAVDAQDFELQMRALREYFTVLPLAEAVDGLGAGQLPSRAVAITFDDGYADNAVIALPILKAHGLHATFFVADGFLNGGRMFNDTVIEAVRRIRSSVELRVPGLPPALPAGSTAEKRDAVARILRVAKYLAPDERSLAVERIARLAESALPDDLMMTDEQVRTLVRAGMDVGGHTVNHPILSSVDTGTARREIELNRRRLGAITGTEPRLFAYPNGVPGKDFEYQHTQLVRAAGYQAAVTTSWGAARPGNDLYQLPRFTPWDRDPKRFALRLMHNLVARRPDLLRADGTAQQTAA
jgi:peptidoglycan/xylan/chitin deacetylase (PgdA/CDA1 family)